MTSILTEIFDAICEMVDRELYEFGDHLMSYEAHKILFHSEDRKVYLHACEELRKGSKEETFVLHTGEEITIY